MGDVGVVEIDDWEDVWMINLMIIIIIIIIIVILVYTSDGSTWLSARANRRRRIRECSRSRRQKRPSTF